MAARLSLRKKLVWLLPLCLLTVFLMAATVSAASKSQLDNYPKTFTYEITKPITYFGLPCDKGGKIVKNSFKATGSKYAKVSYNYDTSEKKYYIEIEPRKPGKASCSFKYTYKGKTRKYTFSFNIQKYVCPVASFKIGSKNFTSAYKTDFKHNVTKKVSGKVSVKAKKGWKISNMSFSDSKGNYKAIKNGTKVAISKNCMLYVTFTKGNKYENLQLNFW